MNTSVRSHQTTPHGNQLKQHIPFKESVYSIVKKYKRTKDSTLYKPITDFLKQKPLPSKLCCLWLSQLSDVIPLLDSDTEPIIMDTLKIDWHCEDENIESHILKFVSNLVTAHNYFAVSILKHLITLCKLPEESEEPKLNPLHISEQRRKTNYKIVKLIHTITKLVPLCDELLVTIARESFPYFLKKDYLKNAHIYILYTYTLLQLTNLMPALRRQFLEIIFKKLIEMDQNSPRNKLDDDSDVESDDGSEDMFNMEVDNETVETKRPVTKHPIGHALDSVMTLMFRYIHFTAHGGQGLDHILDTTDDQDDQFTTNDCNAGVAWEATIEAPPTNGDVKDRPTNGCECRGKNLDMDALRKLYLDVKEIFCRHFLPTYKSSHPQFLMFYVLSLRPTLVTDFLDFLLNIFATPGNAPAQREMTVSCLGSLLARARFIRFSHVHYCMKILRAWCKSYLQSEHAESNKFEDLQLHHQFYCACQTIFYVFTFKYKAYTESRARLKLAQSLHLDELVLSPLNPLRFCNQAICLNFAAVTSHYQLAYCYSVLQKNCRLFLPVATQNSFGRFEMQQQTLNAIFPFDPYLLKRSESFICDNYQEFEGLPEEILPHSVNLRCKNREENDDNIDEDSLFGTTPETMEFPCQFSTRFKNF